jgi:hypothetical protein
MYSLSERNVPYADMIRELGATIRVIKRQGHFDVSRIVKLALLLRKDRIDILHSVLFVANGYAWPARVLARVPWLVSSARNCKEIGFLRGWVNSVAFLMSDAIACNGDAVRSYVVKQYHAPRDRSVVIYNGLDLAHFETASRALKTPESSGNKKPTVITIGRLVSQKNCPCFWKRQLCFSVKRRRLALLLLGTGLAARLSHGARRKTAWMEKSPSSESAMTSPNSWHPRMFSGSRRNGRDFQTFYLRLWLAANP